VGKKGRAEESTLGVDLFFLGSVKELRSFTRAPCRIRTDDPRFARANWTPEVAGRVPKFPGIPGFSVP
jgi:hypothetical protein